MGLKEWLGLATEPVSRFAQENRIIVEMTAAQVAPAAKNTAHCARLVVMVSRPIPLSRHSSFTNSTTGPLLFKPFVKFFERYAVM